MVSAPVGTLAQPARRAIANKLDGFSHQLFSSRGLLPRPQAGVNQKPPIRHHVSWVGLEFLSDLNLPVILGYRNHVIDLIGADLIEDGPIGLERRSGLTDNKLKWPE